MIELLSAAACVRCNICVAVCPTNVFEPAPGTTPQIARQTDCQTCFMCEAYCPADALYVSPYAEQPEMIDQQSLAATNLLGSYRRQIGWGARHGQVTDRSFHLMP